MKKPRVLLADGHRLVVEACVTLLEPEYEVVAIVMDGRAVIPQAIELCPDAIVLDVGMPLLNGLDASRQPSLDGIANRALEVGLYDG